MSLYGFFENALKHPTRFPRNISEGVVKSLLVGGLLMSIYDTMTPLPDTPEGMMDHSATILAGYHFFLCLGVVLGVAGKIAFGEEPRDAAPRQRLPG